jgi:putative hydrolase of the HAD superfamily
VLDETGLAPLVDGAVISAEVGIAKPDPAIFMRALELAGAGADEALHVGDTADADLAGARAAGIRALHLDRSGADPEALTSLAELPRLVRSAV